MAQIVEYHPISTLPDFEDCPDHILLWNPCDGPHVMWAKFDPARLRDIRAGRYKINYSAWAICPEPRGNLRDFPAKQTA